MQWEMAETKDTAFGKRRHLGQALNTQEEGSEQHRPWAEAKSQASWTRKAAGPGGQQGLPAYVYVQEREPLGAWEGGDEGEKPVPSELLLLATDPLYSLTAGVLVLLEGSPWPEADFLCLLPGLSSPTFKKA